MFSEKIKPKVKTMFDELRTKSSKIVSESKTSRQAFDGIIKLVSSETSTRSETILSDMIDELTSNALKSAAFIDSSARNVFHKADLRKEIFDKYQFAANTSVDYKEATRIVQSLKVGGGTLFIGGIGEIGVVLIAGLSLSSLVPVPVSILVIAAVGAALVDYLAVEPNRSKKDFMQAVDKYLAEAQQQFLNWFDEVENYFNKRVEDIKRTL